MEFRPCIDIHNGAVKQIVGSTLCDKENTAGENFVSAEGAGYYAKLYRKLGLYGGHVIILNRKDSEYYNASLTLAYEALAAFPKGLVIGGGIDDTNAGVFLGRGASHVIVTSYVFSGGMINMDNLKRLNDAVGPEHIVLDLSCKETDGNYHIATDRWQNISEEILNEELLEKLSAYCDEFLVHAVDREGKRQGVDERLIRILGTLPGRCCYAGGISSCDDIALIREAGGNSVNFTVGSALDIFGGTLSIEEIIKCTL